MCHSADTLASSTAVPTHPRLAVLNVPKSLTLAVPRIPQIASTVEYLAGDNDHPLAIAMIQEMRDLLMSHAAERWIIRQTYALVCSKLVTDDVVSGDVFARELLPYLLELSCDKVPNVRLVVARTLAQVVVRISESRDYPYSNARIVRMNYFVACRKNLITVVFFFRNSSQCQH